MSISTASPTFAAALAATSFIFSLALAAPLVLQVQKRHAPMTVLIASTQLILLMSFLNAIIWWNLDPSSSWKGQGLCDVEVKLYIGLEMSVPGAIACTARQLSLVLNPFRYGIKPSQKQKKRTKWFNITFCAFIPTLRMVLVYIVQPNRYWIIRTLGCRHGLDTSWPTYVLVLLWPLPVALLSLYYTALAVFRVLRHRRENSELMIAEDNTRNKSRIRKLLVLTAVLCLVNMPTRLYLFYLNRLPFIQPYSWSRVHPANWAQSIELAPSSDVDIILNCLPVLNGVVMFIFFGCGHDAQEIYKTWWASRRIR